MISGTKLGKIKNKYHVLDILDYAYCIQDACYLLWSASRTLRGVLLQTLPQKRFLSSTPSSFDIDSLRSFCLPYGMTKEGKYFPELPRSFITHNKTVKINSELKSALEFYQTCQVTLRKYQLTLEWDSEGESSRDWDHQEFYQDNEILQLVDLSRDRDLQIVQIVGCYQLAIDSFLKYPELIQSTKIVHIN